jgi:hypothetical protein
MLRKVLHSVAILALVGSALYAYRTKYDTIYLSEQVAKLKTRIGREREAIAVLRAEWQYVTRPDRIQALADRHLDLQPGAVTQIVRWQDVPMRAAPVDTIGQKLEALGLAEPTNTPSPAPSGGARTPTSSKKP